MSTYSRLYLVKSLETEADFVRFETNIESTLS